MLDNSSLNYSLIWSHLRNLVDLNEIKIPGSLKLVDTIQGRFPVEAYKPIFFECAKKNSKQHLLARSNTFNGSVDWFFNRIIDMPIYEFDEEISEGEFKDKWQSLLRQWYYTNMPENIPCIAIATRIIGNYCDEREGQFLFVILIWHNKVARIFTLDWYEGPLEDCISPEWYIKSSPIISIDNIFSEINNIVNQLPNWKNQIYSIFLNPSFFGKYITKMSQKTSFNSIWKDEFRYNQKENFIQDLSNITRRILESSFF